MGIEHSARKLCGRAGVFVAVLVVVIIAITVALVSPRVRDCENFLTGVWVGDPAFLAKTGLSEMTLYISPRERAGGEWRRQGYLTMIDAAGGEMVSNQSVELAWAGAPGRWVSAFKSAVAASAGADYRVKAAEFTYSARDVMPAEMQVGVDVARGSLTLHTDEVLHAFMYKDNEGSAFADETWVAESE